MFINARMRLATWLMDSEGRDLLETIASLRVKEMSNANYRLKKALDSEECSVAGLLADNEKLEEALAAEKAKGE